MLSARTRAGSTKKRMRCAGTVVLLLSRWFGDIAAKRRDCIDLVIASRRNWRRETRDGHRLEIRVVSTAEHPWEFSCASGRQIRLRTEIRRVCLKHDADFIDEADAIYAFIPTTQFELLVGVTILPTKKLSPELKNCCFIVLRQERGNQIPYDTMHDT